MEPVNFEKEVPKKEKIKLIRAEKKRLKILLSELPEEKKKAAEGLIDECAFMRATLKELREYIDENGLIDEMPQGEYNILRESPAVKSYNTMIQKYTAVCKLLFDIVPTKAAIENEDDFEEFRSFK